MVSFTADNGRRTLPVFTVTAGLAPSKVRSGPSMSPAEDELLHKDQPQLSDEGCESNSSSPSSVLPDPSHVRVRLALDAAQRILVRVVSPTVNLAELNHIAGSVDIAENRAPESRLDCQLSRSLSLLFIVSANSGGHGCSHQARQRGLKSLHLRGQRLHRENEPSECRVDGRGAAF
eukprot:5081195-Prymnesium_polylepis.1